MKILRADKEYREAVAKNTLEYKKDIKNIINETTKAAYKAGDDIVAKAGDMSWHSDLAIWKDAGIKLAKNNNALSQLVAAAQRQLRGDLKNLTRTTGFKGFVGYESVQNLYRTELDKAVIKIMSGTLSQDQVEREVVRNLARSGLRSIDYANGRSDTLDTAVARALRTGCQQMTAAIQDENMESTGENLVYVQEHAGARNEGNGVANHAKWQGKVYYIKPGHDYSEEEARLGYEIKDLWVETGYSIDGAHANNPLGLFGYNCRHLYFPWFEGISELPKPQKKRPSVEYEGRQLDYYAQTQEARKQERKIRALKREKEALDTLGLDSSEVRLKIRQATNKYEAFTSRCNMPRGNRTAYEKGTSDITKTKSYENYKKLANGIVIASKDSQYKEYLLNLSEGNVTLRKNHKRLFEKVKNRGDWVELRKKQLKITDLAALTAYTGDEFAIFTGNNKKILVHGSKKWIISGELWHTIRDNKYIWEAHSHPTFMGKIIPSEEDIQALSLFTWQRKSSIVDLNGRVIEFTASRQDFINELLGIKI